MLLILTECDGQAPYVTRTSVTQPHWCSFVNGVIQSTESPYQMVLVERSIKTAYHCRFSSYVYNASD